MRAVGSTGRQLLKTMNVNFNKDKSMYDQLS